MQGKPGADSSYTPVTTQLIQQARAFFGEDPVFWGRYFATSGTVEYHHATENAPLAAAGIRLLPIARRTANVGGTTKQGILDAQACLSDLLATFDAAYLAAQGGQFLVFLDVEGHPSLSLDYYHGWAQTLTADSRSQSDNQVTLLPCVYASRSDEATWTVLGQASAAGVPCHGAWVARYHSTDCPEAMPDWEASFLTPTVSLPCDILMWQYAENCLDNQIDSSQTNPDIDLEAALLSKLILPPSR